MELGEKLLEARKEAGLSQRQVCGNVITRNMLSRIEHGTVRPSMKTLQYLAQVLGKPVGYFLGEKTASVNEEVMARARECFAEGKYAQVLQQLEGYKEPDALDWERGLLGCLSCLMAAEAAAAQGRKPVEEKYLTLSEQFSSPYITSVLLSRRETRSGDSAQPGCRAAASGQKRPGGWKAGPGSEALRGGGGPREPLAHPHGQPPHGRRGLRPGGGASIKRRAHGLPPPAGGMLPGSGGLRKGLSLRL